MNSVTIRSPLGALRLTANENALVSVEFVKTMQRKSQTLSAVLQKAIKEFEEYFDGKRMHFTVPLHSEGTDFQRAVWKNMQKIKYGTSKSYGALAKAIKRSKAVRAVGTACGKNPLPIIVPCHRVKSASGLGGYSSGISKKKWLLQHEQKNY